MTQSSRKGKCFLTGIVLWLASWLCVCVRESIREGRGSFWLFPLRGEKSKAPSTLAWCSRWPISCSRSMSVLYALLVLTPTSKCKVAFLTWAEVPQTRQQSDHFPVFMSDSLLVSFLLGVHTFYALYIVYGKYSFFWCRVVWGVSLLLLYWIS